MNVAHWLETIIAITLAEFALVILCGAIGACLRVFYKYQIEKKRKQKKRLKEQFLSVYSNHCPYHSEFLSDIVFSRDTLVDIVEEFDKKFKGRLWVDYKTGIANNYLLRDARKKAYSGKWEDRDYASRVFTILPLEEDQAHIVHLLQDISSLIRVTVSLAAASIASDQTLKALALAMAQVRPWGRYAFRDAFIGNRSRTFPWVIQQLEKEQDLQLRSIYVSLLKDHWEEKYFAYLEQDFRSSNDTVRKTAIDVLIRYPTPLRHAQVLSFLDDPNREIRMAVVTQLPAIFGNDAEQHLFRAFNDRDWWVKLKAALAMRKLGEKGLEMLKSQVNSPDPDKAELSQYVLALPMGV